MFSCCRIEGESCFTVFQSPRLSRETHSRYGLSEGSPSEAGIRSDAQMALDYIKSHPLLENTKVLLYGQSIGGAVAIDLAATNPDRIGGLILENTFLNLVSWTRDLF
jgi:pimeloyl-ACP methyl ester carboxylesterase